MNRWIAVAFTLALSSPALVMAQPMATPQAPTYSKAEVKQMTRSAHTPEEYQALASYYKSQREAFRERARGEWSEAIHRSAFDFGPMQKYPRPVDSSMHRYEYFSYEAKQMEQKAAYFEKLSSSTAQ